MVGRVGRNRPEPRPTGVVESLHKGAIPLERFRSRDVLYSVAFPQSVRPAESPQQPETATPS